MARKPIITGASNYSKRIGNIASAATRRNVSKAVYVGADSIRVEARRKIADGAIQGAGHLPSAPGQPPNWDTGHLANNITTQQIGEFVADTTSSAKSEDGHPYAVDLEYGNSKMAARPYMRPSANDKREEIVNLIQNVYRTSILAQQRSK